MTEKRNSLNKRRRRTAGKTYKRVAAFGLWLAFFWSAGIIGPSLLAAAAEDPSTEPGNGKQPVVSGVPWEIISDSVTYDHNSDVYLLKGNIAITRAGTVLTADEAEFDRKNMHVSAKGNVALQYDEDSLSADRLEIDLDNGSGRLENGTIFFYENHMIVKGETLHKIDDQSYHGKRVSVTSCDGDRPDWRITGRDLKVTIEGYGILKHATFQIKNIPILYTPYLIFPVKLQRQSGLLAPWPGHSKRKGFEYQQPFFWAINQSSDATFYLHSMANRGVKPGVEYRYVVDGISKATFMYDGFSDHWIDDTDADEKERRGYITTDDPAEDFPRLNTNRYWFRMKLDQQLPLGIMTKLDVDMVSDQDYLRDFKDGPTGFTRTNAYYYRAFGRELQDETAVERESTLNLNKDWGRYNLNTGIRLLDDSIAKQWDADDIGTTLPVPNGAAEAVMRENATDTSLQRFPYVTFNRTLTPVFNGPLLFQFEAQYTYYYRQEGLVTANGTTKIPGCHRTEVYPRFFLPYTFRPYVSVEPSIGLRETIWQIDNFKGTEDETDNAFQEREKHFNRNTYDARLDIFTEVYKVYAEKNGISKLRHVFKPQLTYEYTPQPIPEDYPADTEVFNNIEGKNCLTWSFTNTFSLKYTHRVPGDTAERYHYRNDYCRFKIGQSYDLNELNEDDPQKRRNRATLQREPLRPIVMELNYRPNDTLALDIKGVTWNVYTNTIDTHHEAVTFVSSRKDKLSIDHHYLRYPDAVTLPEFEEDMTIHDPLEYITILMDIVLTDNLLVHTEWERELSEGENSRVVLGLLDINQCWSVNCQYKEEDDDRKYEVVFSLNGLGEAGPIPVGAK